MKLPFIALLLSCIVLSAGDAPKALRDIPLKDINGKASSLKEYEGKVLLIVNVASQCGLTPQYAALESIHRKYKAKGFSVLGFPSNDFGEQEPGTNEQIKQFCSSRYNVTFPMFDKVSVKGTAQHPLYSTLTGTNAAFPGAVEWNFGKFLVGRDGTVLARFKPKTKPDSPEITQAIEKALAAK